MVICKFTPLSRGYEFIDLDDITSIDLICSISAGAKWFFSITTPLLQESDEIGCLGSFGLVTGYNALTQKFTYTVSSYSNCNFVEVSEGNYEIEVIGYSITYSVSINLDTGIASIKTKAGTATGTTIIRMNQTF